MPRLRPSTIRRRTSTVRARTPRSGGGRCSRAPRPTAIEPPPAPPSPCRRRGEPRRGRVRGLAVRRVVGGDRGRARRGGQRRARARRDRRPRRLHGARGDAAREAPLGGCGGLEVQRRIDERGCSRTRSRRSATPAFRRTRSPSSRCPVHSSCRSRRWRSRRLGVTPASLRSGRSCAARRRTSTTSRPSARRACSSRRSRRGSRSRSACSPSTRVEQGEERISRAADAVRSALEMADLFARLRASARQ